MPGTSSDTQTAERELVITRVFDAPRELVFKAWTEPDRIKQWLAPRGFTIPFCEGELRPGGKWRQTMRKPDGTELKLGGVYREVVAPERIVFTHAWEDENGNPGHETTVTVILAERNGKTEMTFRQGEFESTESQQGHSGGWGECFDKLAEYLSKK